jgi:CO dehydrogenase/acetyl-CoA synthase epsilon subunit
MEFYFKNATLLYYVNCLIKRKYYLNKNLKTQKHFSLSLLSVKVTLYFQVDASHGFMLTKDNCIIF